MDEESIVARAFRPQLMRDVQLLANTFGERHDGSAAAYASLQAAADYIDTSLVSAGWITRRERFTASKRRRVENVIAERRGVVAPDEIVLVGAHYDSIRGGPGADDNASGVAALLALARELSANTDRTMRLVAFTNEEPPHTRRKTMGSLVHARACRARGEHIVAMLSLECLGCHVRRGDRAAARRKLRLPQRLVPVWTNGAFVVANLQSRTLAARVATMMRCAVSSLPIRRITAPGFLPLAKSSDHWSFWKNGYRAAMITDGGPLRYRHYHRPTDRAELVDADALAEVTRGIVHATERLARRDER